MKQLIKKEEEENFVIFSIRINISIIFFRL